MKRYLFANFAILFLESRLTSHAEHFQGDGCAAKKKSKAAELSQQLQYAA